MATVSIHFLTKQSVFCINVMLPSPVLAGGMNVPCMSTEHSSGVLQLHWCHFIKDLEVLSILLQVWQGEKQLENVRRCKRLGKHQLGEYGNFIFQTFFFFFLMKCYCYIAIHLHFSPADISLLLSSETFAL